MVVVLPVEPTLGKPKKLLDQVCDVMRLKHYSLRTEEAYLGWIKRFILSMAASRRSLYAI